MIYLHHGKLDNIDDGIADIKTINHIMIKRIKERFQCSHSVHRKTNQFRRNNLIEIIVTYIVKSEFVNLVNKYLVELAL